VNTGSDVVSLVLLELLVKTDTRLQGLGLLELLENPWAATLAETPRHVQTVRAKAVFVIPVYPALPFGWQEKQALDS
jgi:hypothetical protein